MIKKSEMYELIDNQITGASNIIRIIVTSRFIELFCILKLEIRFTIEYEIHRFILTYYEK